MTSPLFAFLRSFTGFLFLLLLGTEYRLHGQPTPVACKIFNNTKGLSEKTALYEQIQQEVNEIWPQVTSENLREITDFAGYQEDFLKLFGFGLSGGGAGRALPVHAPLPPSAPPAWLARLEALEEEVSAEAHESSAVLVLVVTHCTAIHIGGCSFRPSADSS